MRAPTHTTGPTPSGRGLQQPGYGVPSPALLARADKGIARVEWGCYWEDDEGTDTEMIYYRAGEDENGGDWDHLSSYDEGLLRDAANIYLGAYGWFALDVTSGKLSEIVMME